MINFLKKNKLTSFLFALVFFSSSVCVNAYSPVYGGSGTPTEASPLLMFSADTAVGKVANLNLSNLGNVSAVSFTGAITESDPIVGAVIGLIKADGSGNISAAIADTDYLVNIVADTTPELGDNLDALANDLLHVDHIFGETAILPLQIGDAGTTSHSLDTEDDLLVTGDQEVGGTLFVDGDITTVQAIGRDTDNEIAWTTDNVLNIVINAVTHAIASISTGTGDNDKFVTQGYVDDNVTAQDLDTAGDTGTGAVDLDSQSLTIAGTTNEITTVASNQTVTVSLPASVTIGTALTVTNGGTLDADGMDLVAGNTYEINGDSILTAESLGANVLASSLTSLGTLVSLTMGGNIDVGAYDLLHTDSIFGSTSILPVRIGDAGTTSQSLASEDDLLVSGKLEIDGESYFDSTVNLDGNAGLNFGVAEARMEFDTTQAVSSLLIATGPTSNSLLLVERGDVSFNFAHAQQTDPTLYIHSHNQATDEWIGLSHDGTDSIISAGKGDVKIDADLSITGDYNMSFPIDLGEDSEFVTLFDKEVTATPTAGTEESVYMSIDHEDFITLYAEADSSGGLQNDEVQIFKQIDLQSGVKFNITDVDGATYDTLPDDNILHVSYTATGAVTSLTLDTDDVVAGRVFTIKDAGGLAGTNSITVDTEGAETIDGSATYVLNANYQAINIYSDGTDWFIY